MGPLAGVRIVELAGLGPAQMCAMLLADLGATVIRIDRKEPSGLGLERPRRFDVVLRNRKSIRVDLKDPAGVALVLDLAAKADALIEGFRPEVTERLGLGPEACFARNPKLVYARATGWGQQGPLAQAAGHDLNYIAVTGVLMPSGERASRPRFRSTSSATTPAGRRTAHWASSRRSSSHAPRARDRWWMRPSSMGWPR